MRVLTARLSGFLVMEHILLVPRARFIVDAFEVPRRHGFMSFITEL